MKGPLVTGRVRGTIAAVALGGVLALTGCGTNDTAAIVDGTRISEADAATAAQQINKQFPPDPTNPDSVPMTTTRAVGLLIYAPAIIAVATESGHPQAADGARSQLTNIADPNPATIEMVRANNALTVLHASDPAGLTKVLARIRALKVSLNPRFGTFDAAKSQIVPLAEPWVSTSGK